MITHDLSPGDVVQWIERDRVEIGAYTPDSAPIAFDANVGTYGLILSHPINDEESSRTWITVLVKGCVCHTYAYCLERI